MLFLYALNNELEPTAGVEIPCCILSFPSDYELTILLLILLAPPTEGVI